MMSISATPTEASLSNNVTRVASPITTLGEVTLKPLDLIAALRNELPVDAPILAPGHDGYNKELVSWNHDVVHRPAVIVQPLTTAHVSALVVIAVKYSVRLTIAGGRHGHDCLADDALICDLSKMKKVVVDPEKRTVTCEGGCKLGDMDVACAPYNLAAVTGTNPDTGVVGLSTAGGGGYLSRAYGMAADNFVSAEVVLASGEAVVATHDNEHRDLLWGLAGAGSNFGIVTKLEMKVHPVGHVFGGMVINVAPSVARAKTVLTNWRDWIVDAPKSVMSMAVLPCGAPVVPMAIAETDQVHVPQGPGRARCTANRLPNLKDALGGWSPLSAIGKSFGALLTIKQTKRQLYHTGLQPQLEAVQPSGHYYDASCLVPALSDEVISTLVTFTRQKHVNSDAGIIIFPLGGAISDAPIESTAFYGGGRKPHGFWIIIEGKWVPDKKGMATNGGVDVKRAEVVGWVKALRAELAQYNVSDTAHTLDGNMESEMLRLRESEEAGVRAIFGPNYEKVKQVKGKYDPTNFFKCNRNVAP